MPPSNEQTNPNKRTKQDTNKPNKRTNQSPANPSISYPFLLVDRVVELAPEKYAVGYKNVTANDQFFNGHFPERAIMPGVLQVRARACWWLVSRGK